VERLFSVCICWLLSIWICYDPSWLRAQSGEREQTSRQFHWSSTQSTGLLIPLYIYPANIHTNESFNQVMMLKRDHPSVPFWVILNPGSGPGKQPDANYVKAIDRLQGAGCLTLGYVSTEYGKRETKAIDADLTTWLKLYPKIQGVFFDEMMNTDSDSAVEHQRQLTTTARSEGFWPVVCNPGTDVPTRYFEGKVADVFVVYENASWPTEKQLHGDYFGGYSDYPISTRSALVHSADKLDASQVRMMRHHSQWIYVTDDTLPADKPQEHPWDRLPSYLPELVNLLDSLD
jgi:hypothetical protein